MLPRSQKTFGLVLHSNKLTIGIALEGLPEGSAAMEQSSKGDVVAPGDQQLVKLEGRCLVVPTHLLFNDGPDFGCGLRRAT